MVRWILAVFTIFGGFSLVGFLTILVAELSGLWTTPYGGFAAAMAAVVVTWLAVPRHREAATAVTLMLGVLGAWMLLRHETYPEGHPRAYALTLIPLIATYAGAVVGLVVVFVLRRRV